MSKINIPLNFEMKGSIKSLKLIDTRTGEVAEKRENINNKLLGRYLNRIFTSSGSSIFCHEGDIIGTTTCHIGDNGTAVSLSDNAVLSEIGGVEFSNKTESSLGDNPHYAEYTFLFSAGVGTGTIKEIGVSLGETYEGISRISLSENIIKEDYHELEVVWKFEISKPVSWNGTISGGQKDGTTDINFTIDINDKNWFGYAKNNDCVYMASSQRKPNPFSLIFNLEAETPYIKVGDSNISSDLENDSEYTIKGETLYSGTDYIHEADPYTDNSFSRSFRIGLEPNQANGSIGELVISTDDFNSSHWPMYHYDYGLFRVVFTPKLDKTSNYRLYLDFTISVSDGNNP